MYIQLTQLFVHQQSRECGQPPLTESPRVDHKDDLSLINQDQLRVVGTNRRLVDTYALADYADVYAAMNRVMVDVGDTEHAELHLPYTGSTPLSAST